MTEYLVFVIAAGAVVGFGGFMLYGGEVAKPSKTALAIILLSAVIMPIADAVGSIGEVSAGDILGSYGEGNVDGGLYEETAEQAFCEGICKVISDEFSIKREEVTVRCFGFSLTEMRAEKIKVILSGSAAYKDTRAIAARISEAGLGECEVELEFSG